MMSNIAASSAKMRTSVKVTILLAFGVIVIILINNQFFVKRQELDKLETMINVAGNGDGSTERPQFSLEYDSRCEICKQSLKKKIHLITTFFPMEIVRKNAKLLLPNSDYGDKVQINQKNSKSMFQRRDRELLDVLQMNLNNNYIIAIHIIYNNEKVVKHIMNQKLRFTRKLIFHWVESNPTFEQAMLYIGKHLLHQLVVFTNQDIYLGRGWQVLDHERIKERKLMYALTRHGKKERYCKMPDHCARSAPYTGSHDAFVFILTEMPNKGDLTLLRHKNDHFGVENIMIYIFEKKLGYEVINPCFVLYVYHVHCARVFSRGRVRVNRYNTTGLATFIDHLYV